MSPPKTSRIIKEEMPEDCSTEKFFHTLLSRKEKYTYSRLKFDFLHPEVHLRLPPRPYAFHLLQAFEEGFSEYHWFLRKDFRDRLMLTYSDPSSQSKDRNWLCRVSVVLALAESFNRSRMTASTHMQLTGEQPPSPYGILPPVSSSPTSNSESSETPQAPPPPPGSDYFEQGLMLLKMSSEEPVSEDVEALNLIAFYCYSLNRRKTAYSYASQSCALAKLLHLHKPVTAQTPVDAEQNVRVMNEHRKRLWWTSYCMDRMISTELGVSPALASVPEGMQLPCSAGFTSEDLEQFSDPSLLTASTQLCEIKRHVVITAAQHSDVDDGRRLDIIKPCIDMLHDWRANLPSNMTFTFEDSLPTRLMEAQYGRILASIYMRYHQCSILLLRPLYLQRLSSIVQTRRLNSQQTSSGRSGVPSIGGGDSMKGVKMQCLQAARNNCKILLGLWNYDKIAKFGYWESLHLFSGLSILALARVSINHDRVSTSSPEDHDAALYSRTRELLREMARVGNPAAKDHDALLSDVEAMVMRVQEEERLTEQTSTEIETPNENLSFSDFMFADMGSEQQIWCDTDWENILSSYTQGI
ncbi:Proline utilization trans-activator [Colletotrichum tropicale]|nr:Proline utilization trans-activator [Colletotrichum tropicale]